MSIRDVPVFAEHETTTKDGRTLRFGRAELEAVANRCNRRIAETGDYAALSIGHTPPAGSGLPPLKAVGFAGPFKVASMSGEMGRERYAITADFHVRRTEWEEAQKYIARRSPELWVEDTYEEMFLDPIALLGAEVPRLDMGLVYSRVHPGKLVEKYAAVFEGPGSVHIPQKDYQGEAGPMLDDQDLARIVDAIQQLPEFVFIQSQMAASSQGTAPGGVPGQAPPAAPMPGAPAPPPAVAAAAPPPADSPITPAGAVPAAPPPAAATMPEPPQAKDAGLDAPGGEPGLDAPGGDPPSENDNPKDEDDEMSFVKKFGAAMMDMMEDNDLEEYMAGRKKRNYSAESKIDGDDKPDADAGTYDQTANEAEGVGGSEHTIQEGTGGPPRKESEKVHSSKSSGESETLKYQLDAMKAKVAKLESESQSRYEEKTDANRRARLLQLHHEGYVLDPDKMMERLCYSKMREDSQFDGFVDAILENTPRAPLNLDLPYVEGVERYSRHRPGTKQDTEKYSKEQQDQAYKNVMRRVNSAPPMTDTTGWLEEELSKLNGVA